jgi:hypothetical protein
VDEVEAFLAKQPWFGEVVNFESQIRWDERWLRRAEIRPEYLDRLDIVCIVRTLYRPRLMGIYPQSRCADVNGLRARYR